MAEVLSQKEIDMLLSTITSSDHSPESPTATASDASKSRSFKIYDWKRPDRFGKQHIRSISTISEHVTRGVAASLEHELSVGFSFSVASIDQLLYEEFRRSVPSPTFIASVLMDPLPGLAVIEIDPLLAATFVSVCHGMREENIPALVDTFQQRKIIKHLFTEIGIDTLETILSGMLASLRVGWSSVLDLKPRIASIETEPSLADFVPYSEMIILVTVSVRVKGEDLGMLNIAYPWSTLEPVLPKLEQSCALGTPASSDHIGSIRTLTGSRPVIISGEYLLSCAQISAASLASTLETGIPLTDNDPFSVTYRMMEDRDHV